MQCGNGQSLKGNSLNLYDDFTTHNKYKLKYKSRCLDKN